jgi:hypothetical protein
MSEARLKWTLQVAAATATLVTLIQTGKKRGWI